MEPTISRDIDSNLNEVKTRSYVAFKRNLLRRHIALFYDPLTLLTTGLSLIKHETSLSASEEQESQYNNFISAYSTWVQDMNKAQEHEVDIKQEVQDTVYDVAQRHYDVMGMEKIKPFCKDHGIEKACEVYVSTAIRVFKDAEIALSIVADPEIKDDEKIKLNIKTINDFETIMKWDYDFFRAIDILLADPKENSYFVKTYEIDS